jgi:hypothetical protein
MPTADVERLITSPKPISSLVMNPGKHMRYAWRSPLSTGSATQVTVSQAHHAQTPFNFNSLRRSFYRLALPVQHYWLLLFESHLATQFKNIVYHPLLSQPDLALECQCESGKDKALRNYRRSPRIRFLELEVVVEKISHTNCDET